MSQGEENCKWTILTIKGQSPGKRYGHSMCYYKPYIVLFGGNSGSKLTNQTWIINISDFSNLEWERLDWNTDSSLVPSSRTYHSMALCKYGVALGMIIVYGGRGEDNTALSDTWGLRMHRNKTWDWLKAPYTQNYQPLKRFQVIFNKYI